MAIGCVDADGGVEDGLEGEVAVDEDGALRFGVVVAPLAEGEAGEGTGKEGGGGAEIVDTGAVDGSHVGVLGGGVDGEGLGCEDGGVGGIGQDANMAGVVGGAVAPVFEEVVGGGVGGDGDLLAGGIGAGA